ncbi:MAG: DUF4340 domain-containing protein [Planctomycetes bacterium]|nr:DUF4340 domain-containing protein [Planctomycetota bacterium]
MNWKSTITLVLLASAAGAWFFMGDAWKPKLGLGPVHTEPTLSAAGKVVDSLVPQDITSIKVTFASGDPLEVKRVNPCSPWTMPGNWPPRVPEVQELARTLGTIRTRFHPEVLGETPDLAKYGLAPDQKPVAVAVGYKKLDQGGKLLAEGTLDLLFGEPPIPEGETTFTRPAYVRITAKDTDGKDQSEIVKLGPDVMPIIRRTTDSYRRRLLFPDIERVKLAGSTPPPNPLAPPPPPDVPTTVTLPGLNTESITVTRPGSTILGFDLSAISGYTLKRIGKLPEPGVIIKGGEPTLRTDRLADAWRLISPTEDNPEPERLRAVLAAVADLWIEEFVHPVPEEAKLGFGPQSRSVTVKGQGSEPVTVRFGGIAKTVEREEMVAMPGGPPGSPPRMVPRKVSVEYQYARVDGNPQVFLVASEKLGDIFVSSASLADPRVARFDAGEVQQIVITRTAQQPITLTRKKANPKATTLEDRSDRWVIAAQPNDLPADARAVAELIDQLTQFRADSADRRTYPAKEPTSRTTATVTARENRAEGEPDAPERKYELHLGTNETDPSLLAVFLPDRRRVTLVEYRLGPDDPTSWIASRLFPETVSSLIERPAITYRNRKLFDTADASLQAVTVPAGFTLRHQTDGWKLTAPVTSEADATKAGQLTQSLTDLRVTDYITETPTAEQLATFGLGKPAHTATLTFDNGRSYTLEIGSPRPGKAEVFARLDGGAVFGLPATAAEPFITGAIGLLPLKVWATQPDRLTSVQITRFGDSAKQSFTLTKDNTDWKLSGPFSATVTGFGAQPLLTSLGSLTAVKYQALSSANTAEFGFDKPLLSVKVTLLEKKPGAMEETPVTNTVIVGGLTPDGGNRFAKLDAPNAPVFVIPGAFVTAAQIAPLELPDRALLSLDPSKVASVRVAGGKPEDTFALSKDAAGKWTAEGATFGVDPTRISELSVVAARLPITRLAAYGDATKWADYGLEKPDTTITVTTAGEKPETHTIALGNPDPTGSRFARIDDKPAVAVIPSTVAEVLTRRRFDYADRTLLKFDPTTITSITRTKNKEELELVPGAAVGWELVKPAKQKADATFVDELADMLGRLRAERVAAYGKKDDVFKQYGLEPAAAVVTLTVGDKAEQKTLRIGNAVDAAKPDGDRYAAVDSPAAEIIVGVLPAVTANKLLSPPLAFRDRTLANFVDVDKAVFERGDRKITFAKTGAMWKVTEPVAADAEAALAELLVDLGGLRADVWVGEKGKDSKEYGLDKPEAKWTLSYGDKAVLVLLIGKKVADGRVAVAADGKELIGLLTPTLSARVLAEYRARRVWTVDAAQTEGVEVSLGSATFAFEKAGPQWVDPAKPGDMLDVRFVNELIGTLGALRAERYAVDKDADVKLFGLEKPEATITAISRRGQKATLEIGGVVGGTDGKQRYARVAGKDGGEVFVLSAADTARLTRERTMYTLKK